MDARILIVEDEELVADMVRLNLEHAGYKVEQVGTGEAALEALKQSPVDLIVLDRMLPGIDGLTVAAQLRRNGDATPILMLTARGELSARVAGLDAGADDYLAKPFAMPELLARVRALIRRHTTPRGLPSSRTLNMGHFWANFDTREALTNEGTTLLTEKEAALLLWFATHEGEVLSRTEILENVWGMDSFPTSRTVDNYVLRLRKLFEPDPENPLYFLTIRGTGYRFVR